MIAFMLLLINSIILGYLSLFLELGCTYLTEVWADIALVDPSYLQKKIKEIPRLFIKTLISRSLRNLKFVRLTVNKITGLTNRLRLIRQKFFLKFY